MISECSENQKLKELKESPQIATRMLQAARHLLVYDLSTRTQPPLAGMKRSRINRARYCTSVASPFAAASRAFLGGQSAFLLERYIQ
jgi:hypothetical protein